MRADDWDTLSTWLSAWHSADATGRARLRAQLAVDHPQLTAAADRLSSASGRIAGFLETPAVLLAAGQLVDDVAADGIPAGALLGPYRIGELLARGGMGDVYRGIDVRLQRPAALKVLSQSRSSDVERIGRFMQEARMTASLDHPNVVRVYDVGVVDDRAYLATELLEGETLRARIMRGGMSIDEVTRIGLDLTKGLAAAHAEGLVHRDLKPENVFLTKSWGVKILDFGIAKLAQDETVRAGTSTLPGVVFGTAGYLAPEQIRGGSVDLRADLFALGAVLFEMLTGTCAFERGHVVETLHAILHDPAPDVVSRRSDAPPALVALVARLLQKSPDARCQSTADVMSALEGVDARSRHFSQRPRVIRWTAAAALVLVLALAAGAARWWVHRASRPAPSERPAIVLAVMPFRSIPDASDVIEIGLPDVLVNRLSRLADIRVLPIAATERLRAAPSSEVGQRLGATHVLTGTVQREGGAVRATVQLVSTAENRTTWSSPVDTDASTLFAIQDIVVTRVLEELAPQLTGGARRALAQAGTRDGAAYEAYVQGRALAARPSEGELVRAAQLFDRAVRLDPNFADAWAALGTVTRMLPLFDGVPTERFLDAKRMAARALSLEPNHAEALSVLGTVAFWHDWDYAESERLLRRAVERQPSSTQAYLSLAHLLSNVGRHDEALLEIRRARTLDQEWPLLRSLEGQFLFMARRYEDSLAHLTDLVALDPTLAAVRVMRTYPLIALHRYEEAIRSSDEALDLHRRMGASTPHSLMVALRGYALARLGRTAEAEAVLAALRAQRQQQYVPPHHDALLLHALGRDDEALQRLRDAVDGRDMFVTFVGVDPKWDALRDRPEFRALVARASLLDVSERARR